MADTSRRKAPDHPLQPRGIRIFFWFMLTVVVAGQGAGVYRLCIADQKLCDFGRFYYAVREWHAGGKVYVPNFATPKSIGGQTLEMMNVASPLWHVLVIPWSRLPPAAAFTLWVLCNAAAWGWSVRLCLKVWRVTIDPRTKPVVALAVLGCSLTAGMLHTGQYVGLLMVPATYAWLAARKGSWRLTGALLGFLAYNKPFVLILLAWMGWRRHWNGVIVAVATIAAAVVVGELALGRGIHAEWRHALEEDVTLWTWLYINGSIWAPWARAFRDSPAFGHVDVPALATVAPIACASIIGLVTAAKFRRMADVDTSWAILWVAALLISPLGWTYYLWWATGPLGMVILTWWRERRFDRVYIVAVAVPFFLPLGVLLLGQPSPVASFLIGSMFSWSLLALWTMGVRELTMAPVHSSSNPQK